MDDAILTPTTNAIVYLARDRELAHALMKFLLMQCMLGIDSANVNIVPLGSCFAVQLCGQCQSNTLADARAMGSAFGAGWHERGRQRDNPSHAVV